MKKLFTLILLLVAFSATQSQIRITRLASTGTDYGYEIALSPSGDIYVAGQTGSTSSFVTPTYTYGNSTGGSDAFVCRFDSNLNLLATAIIASSSNDEALGITVDESNGNVFVCGTTRNVPDFAVNSTTWGNPSAADRNGFVAKLSPSLDTLYNTAIICSNDKDEAHDVIVGYDGSVFVTGEAGNDGFICNSCPGKSELGDSDGMNEAFVSKLTNDLTHVYTVLLTSDEEDEAYSVKIDANNFVYITGRTKNFGDFADSKEYYGGSPNLKVGYSVFVSRFDYALDHKKTGILGSDVVSDVARAMVIDSSGSIFLAGLTEHSATFPKNPKYYYGPAGTPDAFVVKLSNSLSNHSATAIPTSNDKDKIYAMTLDKDENVLVGGYTDGTGSFGVNATEHGSHVGSEDAFIMKLSNDLATHISTDLYTSDGTDEIWGLAVSSDGGILAVGESAASPSNFTDEPNTVIGTAGGEDAFLMKIGGFIAGSGAEPFDNGNAFILYTPEGPVLELSLAEGMEAGYEVWNAAGQRVEKRAVSYFAAGQHRFELELPAAGVYLVRVSLEADVVGLKCVGF